MIGRQLRRRPDGPTRRGVGVARRARRRPDRQGLGPRHRLPGLAGGGPVRPHHRHRVACCWAGPTPEVDPGQPAPRSQRHRRLQRGVGCWRWRRCPAARCWPSWPKYRRPGRRRWRPWARMISPPRPGRRSARPTTGASCRSGCSTAGSTSRTSATPSAGPATRTGPVAEQSVDEIVRALGYIVGKKAGAPEGSTRHYRADRTGRRTSTWPSTGRARGRRRPRWPADGVAGAGVPPSPAWPAAGSIRPQCSARCRSRATRSWAGGW